MYNAMYRFNFITAVNVENDGKVEENQGYIFTFLVQARSVFKITQQFN